jgi:hypothetical protein
VSGRLRAPPRARLQDVLLNLAWEFSRKEWSEEEDDTVDLWEGVAGEREPMRFVHAPRELLASSIQPSPGGMNAGGGCRNDACNIARVGSLEGDVAQ